LAVAVLGFFIITLDALIVAIALPAIARSLGGGISGLQWVVDAYTLAFAGLLLLAGTLSDRLGARRSFGWGSAIFVIASAGCAGATNITMLVIARALQGLGAALMTPASLALIREAYPDPRIRTRAIGVWAAAGAVASAAGPLAGGLLTQIDWRLIFLVNVPVGALALLILRRVPSSPTHATPFDWLGQVVGIAALLSLTWAVIEGGVVGYTSRDVLVALGLSGVAAVVFVLVQRRVPHPTVPGHIVASFTVRAALFASFAFLGAFFGMVFLMTLYLQEGRGLSALAAGLMFLPTTVIATFVNVAAGRLAAHHGPRLPLTLGLISMAAGLGGLAWFLESGPLALLILLMAPVGAGGALASPPVTALMLDHADARWAGTASGLLNTSRQMGAALAVACFGALIAGLGLATGARAGLAAAAAVILIALTLVRIDRTPPSGHRA
jgi:DHA2 family methylenomycin A resistance protein-like MFS transporter